MNRRLLSLVSLAVLATAPGLAAEGMWQPHQMPELADELRALGLELDPASMTRLTEFPMNAVISLGGCTASFVSPQGLVVTNHHCAYGSLQFNSTEERNLLENGFLATTREAEVPAAPGQRVYVTVEAREITKQITKGLVDSLEPQARYDAIEDRRKQAIAACEADAGHRCSVSSFHGGLEYWLIKRLELRDVRLVYAPPRAIGLHGGDVDNWMWPRHTGDFAYYRAYVGPDGAPADHDEANVPYRPKHHLKLAAGGVRPDDLVMVVGYPGRTNRYRLAREVAGSFDWYYPTARELMLEMLEIIERETDGREAAAIKYASTVAGLNNATKNFLGMIEGYANSGMLERKRAREEALRGWITATPRRAAAYGAALDELNELIAADEATRERDLLLGMMARSSLLSAARRLYRLAHESVLPDPEREPGYQERDLQRIRQSLERMDRRFDPEVDRALWAHLIGRYRELPADQRIEAFDRFMGLDDVERDLGETLESMYEQTGLDDLATRLAWMERGREAFESSDDPFVRLAVALYESDREREAEDERRSGELLRVRPRVMEAMIAMMQDRGEPIYADANGTLRVTYGTVRGYTPRDGVLYTPFTTLEGIVEKQTGEEPFDAPAEQLALIAKQVHGDYGLDSLGSVPVNFLSTVDTTGGNSGSPTINGRGELVGLLFDGTYDSINSDWDFNVETTRSIHVDSRYMLWVMQYVDGADGLLRELGIEVEARAATGGAAAAPAGAR